MTPDRQINLENIAQARRDLEKGFSRLMIQHGINFRAVLAREHYPTVRLGYHEGNRDQVPQSVTKLVESEYPGRKVGVQTVEVRYNPPMLMSFDSSLGCRIDIISTLLEAGSTFEVVHSKPDEDYQLIVDGADQEHIKVGRIILDPYRTPMVYTTIEHTYLDYLRGNWTKDIWTDKTLDDPSLVEDLALILPEPLPDLPLDSLVYSAYLPHFIRERLYIFNLRFLKPIKKPINLDSREPQQPTRAISIL